MYLAFGHSAFLKFISLPFLLMLMLQQKQTFLKEAVGVGVVEEGRGAGGGAMIKHSSPFFLLLSSSQAG